MYSSVWRLNVVYLFIEHIDPEQRPMTAISYKYVHINMFGTACFEPK